MMSLRWRLFLILVVSTGFVWLSGIAWIYFGSRSEIQHLLDRRLMEAARMVLSLSASPGTVGSQAPGGPATPIPLSGGKLAYEHRLSCQIWSFDGHLVGRSSNAPAKKLTNGQNGFSETPIDGITYRVYAMEDNARGMRVLVGDNLAEREQVIDGILHSLVIPALVLLPLVALLIWASIRRGLAPLRRATETLSRRRADDLKPIELGCAPSEVRPLISALNELFERVVAARDHERSFVAYAAHELRTPLAGLKTQAQVAAATTDAEMRRRALDLISMSVDRTTRLIQQLLTISRLDASTVPLSTDWIDVQQVIEQVRADIRHDLCPERIVIDASLAGRQVACSRECLELAIRNLLENALQYTPRDGLVRVAFTLRELSGSISIEDQGPGIPDDERDLVLQRFYRGRLKTGEGSGLGLAIVTSALERIDAELCLERRGSGQGLRAEVRIPADRIRDTVATSGVGRSLVGTSNLRSVPA